METTLSYFRKQVFVFSEIALKTRVEPISNLSEWCRTVPVIRGSNLHRSIFFNLLHSAQRAGIHSPHVSSDKNHPPNCISVPLLSLYLPSSTL
jgi:hypothetical protein